jgi:hypothetical protein
MSVNARSVSLNDFTRARTVNHQIVADWALSLGNVSCLEKKSFCMTATIGAANFLYYLHFSTFVFQEFLKKAEEIFYSFPTE